MKTFDIYGIHCSKCGDEYIDWLNDTLSTKSISLSHAYDKIHVGDDVNIDDLDRLLSFNKIYLDTSGDLSNNKQSHSHTDDHDHDHDHDHGHHHHHFDESTPAARMALVFFMNLFFSIIEFIFGTLFNSAAILSDAVHDLGDALSIGLAWFFQKKSERHPDSMHTYGYGRYSMLAALITSVVLIIGAFSMILLSIPRIINPVVVNHRGMFVLALVAIGINGISAWVLSRGSSINEGLLSVHVLEDLFGWVGVLLVGFVLSFTDWYILDPILSLLIAGWILYNTIPQFKNVIAILLNTTPDEKIYQEIKESILNIDGVNSISHLHIWTIEGEQIVVSMTIGTQKTKSFEIEMIKKEARKILTDLSIGHSTIELVNDSKDLLADYPF